MNYALFNPDGFIEYTMSTDDPENLELLEWDYLACDKSVTSGEYYVDTVRRVIKPRKDYSLVRLPLPCTVSISDQDYHCTEQPEFEFPIPGTYLIRVTAGVQYKEKEFIHEQD